MPDNHRFSLLLSGFFCCKSEKYLENFEKNLTAEAKNIANAIQQHVIWDMPETGRVINGRYYGKHALERMAPDTIQVRAELTSRALKKGYRPGDPDFIKYVNPRNIPPIVIEHAIKTGEKIPGRTIDTLVYIGDKVKVVTNLSGDVVTVHAM